MPHHSSLTMRPDPSTGPFRATPLTPGCQSALTARTHACVGVSPFNSYFSVERVNALARWALDSFDRVHFFVPDTAAVHTLEALGYPPERAAWKARRQGQYVRNKIVRALSAAGISEPGAHVLDGQTLASSNAYARLLEQVGSRYQQDEVFAQACLGASAWTLERRLSPGTVPTPAQLRCAVRYFLAELPLFLDTPQIAGVTASVFCYHQVPAFLDDLFHHRLALRPAAGQGYVCLAEVR
ncbi:tRNA-dependent cyclodipeptide synthase [Streptomyces halobius]|uniref:Cyclodipeptide synthase n=1 Tax=Streptomyces halobius TaxID=2879846 RepID=A0ABY4M3Y7_9ACTN|nr:tRNA-dependent cyclodipeptide synthase [Streptomyces halobius]UQA91075.1 tRNA-dependent cyclodipeptide synthase [Streptomyces halobius]